MATLSWDEVVEAVRARPDYFSRIEMGTEAEFALAIRFRARGSDPAPADDA